MKQIGNDCLIFCHNYGVEINVSSLFAAITIVAVPHMS